MINTAVMAGGQSRRFSRDKTLEIFQGKPLIQHPVDILKQITENVIIVAKDCGKYSFAGTDCIKDKYEVQCPMVGILTALKHYMGPVFIAAADMPFVNPAHVFKLSEALSGQDAAIPLINGVQHPLYACYNVSIIKTLEEAVAEGKYSLMKTLITKKVMYCDNKYLFDSEKEEKSFININTIIDFEEANKFSGETNG